MRNRTILMILLVALLVWLISLMATSPAGAQSMATATPRAFATPTPLPAIQATAQAAQQRANEAQSSLSEADRLEAQAAEIRRNAQVQSDQAAQAWSDARAAAAAQNAAAIGEAIGRGEAALDQLRASVNGQGALIATLTAQSAAQAATIISMTNELQQVRVEKQTTLSAYTALSQQQAEHANDNLLGNIATMFIFIMALIVIIALIWHVIQNRPESFEVMPAQRDAVSDDPIIDGEMGAEDVHAE